MSGCEDSITLKMSILLNLSFQCNPDIPTYFVIKFVKLILKFIQKRKCLRIPTKILSWSAQGPLRANPSPQVRPCFLSNKMKETTLNQENSPNCRHKCALVGKERLLERR